MAPDISLDCILHFDAAVEPIPIFPKNCRAPDGILVPIRIWLGYIEEVPACEAPRAMVAKAEKQRRLTTLIRSPLLARQRHAVIPRREITAASIFGVGDHGSLVSAMVVVIQVLPDVEPNPKTEPGGQCPERVTVYNFRRLNLLFGRGRFSSPRHQSSPSSTICKYKGHEGQTYMMAERQMITIDL